MSFVIILSFQIHDEDIIASRRMMNRRFHSPYDDFFLNHDYYDEYQPSHHATSNDVYGRMYSDRNYGELSWGIARVKHND